MVRVRSNSPECWNALVWGPLVLGEDLEVEVRHQPETGHCEEPPARNAFVRSLLSSEASMGQIFSSGQNTGALIGCQPTERRNKGCEHHGRCTVLYCTIIRVLY